MGYLFLISCLICFTYLAVHTPGFLEAVGIGLIILLIFIIL